MTGNENTAVTVLGLGEMGRALAARLLDQGHPTTVWNRSAGRAGALVATGAREADSFHDAVTSSPLVIVCVRDYASARANLEPEAESLAGSTVVNLTTGTPEAARAMAHWAADHGIAYLDGGIMAVPQMIGTPAASLLYSGSPDVFSRYRDKLDAFGTSRFVGNDPGMASLQDLALLAGMYAMFAGAYQAFAMVGSAGVKAEEFADSLGDWLRAMTAALPAGAALVDGGDYSTDVQDLEFNRTGLDTIIHASEDAGIGSDILESIRAMVERQIDAGHGDEHFAQMIESIRGRR